jgi:hypothetical protein
LSFRLFFVLVLLLPAFGGCSETPPPEQAAAPAAIAPAKPPDEAAAIQAIASVNRAQADYMLRNRRYALTYEELIEGFFLREEPAAGTLGYDVKLRPSADAVRYTILAVPSIPSPTTRHFFSDQTGEIRAEQGRDANAQSPTISQ